MEEKFNTGEKRNDSWKYLPAVKGEFFKSKCFSYQQQQQQNPCKLMWGEDYNVDIQNSSSWVSRSGISVWNLQSPSYNFFIYLLISVSSHERPLRKCYFEWIMLKYCFVSTGILESLSNPSPVSTALAKALLGLMQELSPLQHLIKPSPFCYSVC